jgi:diaminopimelate decarboxylase
MPVQQACPVSTWSHRYAYRQQIIDLEPFDDAFALMAQLVKELQADGHNIRHVDVGGGLGIPYRTDNTPPPLPVAYAEIVARHIKPLGLKTVFEPGRLIVGNAGLLVTEVIFVKEGDAKNFVIVDAAMNDLIRPTLYDAFHDIKPVALPKDDAPRIRADFVGPVCETGDYLGLDREVAKPAPGDLIAVCTTGAYGGVCPALQQPPAHSRSAGRWRPLSCRAPAPDL